MSSAGVLWDLVRGRGPDADDAVVQHAVDRLDRAAVRLVLVGVAALLLLLRVLVDLRSGPPDRVGVAGGVTLLLVTVVLAALRRRALATARRTGHPPQRTWT